jgi:hypothetical protein
LTWPEDLSAPLGSDKGYLIVEDCGDGAASLLEINGGFRLLGVGWNSNHENRNGLAVLFL